jgi:hypothetical protein
VQTVISAATEFADDLQAEPEFCTVKIVCNMKCHFQYEAHDKPITIPETKFKINISAHYLILSNNPSNIKIKLKYV